MSDHNTSDSTQRISKSEYEAVIAAAACYIDAMRIGSSKRAREGFHPEGGIYGYVEGMFRSSSITNFFNYLDNHPSGSEIEAHMDVIAITPTTAIVNAEVEIAPPETDYSDFLAIVKVDGK